MNNLYKVRTITCASCGKTVTKRMPATRKHCSHVCFRTSTHPQRQTGISVPCGVCGTTVYIPRSRADTAKTFFCSRAHANEWQGRNKIEYTCKVCGKSFRKSASHEKFGRILYCSPECRYADPDSKARLLEMNAQQQRGNQTEPERIGYELLGDLGINYLPQHTINGKFTVDAFIPSSNTVIQFDGDYWHGNPDRFPDPDNRQRKRMALDLSQDAYMAVCGYRVIRIWASELQSKLSAVSERLSFLLG